MNRSRSRRLNSREVLIEIFEEEEAGEASHWEEDHLSIGSEADFDDVPPNDINEDDHDKSPIDSDDNESWSDFSQR